MSLETIGLVFQLLSGPITGLAMPSSAMLSIMPAPALCSGLFAAILALFAPDNLASLYTVTERPAIGFDSILIAIARNVNS
mgnify:CR=1 FL=1